MYSGKITGIGPRYCPSIEDKVVRFSDKERHQIFLEPEGLHTEEVYVNGVSSSLPFDVQYEFIRSIPSLRNAEIMRPAYAIEYDYVVSGQMDASLECRKVEGLFLAGQINGTSGYEEAAGQGLLAGINAANKVLGKAPLILSRHEAYLGVMIDDLITKVDLSEPYRMFTSRAEHRLLLRQDNADLRLRHYGYQLGMINREQFDRVEKKREIIESDIKRLGSIYKTVNSRGVPITQLLSRPETTYQQLLQEFPEHVTDHGHDTNFQIELAIKYAGYINRQHAEVDKLAHVEKIKIPASIDFNAISGLCNEARQKLNQHRPHSVGQASRIAGISPADISILMIHLESTSRTK